MCFILLLQTADGSQSRILQSKILVNNAWKFVTLQRKMLKVCYTACLRNNGASLGRWLFTL